MKTTINHYKWLDQNLKQFFANIGLPNYEENFAGIIVAHGDKAYGYRDGWEKAGISFHHGVAIFLLTYCHPFSLEVRDTPKGWVAPCNWVVDNYNRFKRYFPENS